VHTHRKLYITNPQEKPLDKLKRLADEISHHGQPDIFFSRFIHLLNKSFGVKAEDTTFNFKHRTIGNAAHKLYCYLLSRVGRELFQVQVPTAKQKSREVIFSQRYSLLRHALLPFNCKVDIKPETIQAIIIDKQPVVEPSPISVGVKKTSTLHIVENFTESEAETEDFDFGSYHADQNNAWNSFLKDKLIEEKNKFDLGKKDIKVTEKILPISDHNALDLKISKNTFTKKYADDLDQFTTDFAGTINFITDEILKMPREKMREWYISQPARILEEHKRQHMKFNIRFKYPELFALKPHSVSPTVFDEDGAAKSIRDKYYDSVISSLNTDKYRRKNTTYYQTPVYRSYKTYEWQTVARTVRPKSLSNIVNKFWGEFQTKKIELHLKNMFLDLEHENLSQTMVGDKFFPNSEVVRIKKTLHFTDPLMIKLLQVAGIPKDVSIFEFEQYLDKFLKEKCIADDQGQYYTLLHSAEVYRRYKDYIFSYFSSQNWKVKGQVYSQSVILKSFKTPTIINDASAYRFLKFKRNAIELPIKDNHRGLSNKARKRRLKELRNKHSQYILSDTMGKTIMERMDEDLLAYHRCPDKKNFIPLRSNMPKLSDKASPGVVTSYVSNTQNETYKACKALVRQFPANRIQIYQEYFKRESSKSKQLCEYKHTGPSPKAESSEELQIQLKLHLAYQHKNVMKHPFNSFKVVAHLLNFHANRAVLDVTKKVKKKLKLQLQQWYFIKVK
jgi:hypothetical protein